MQWSSIVDGNLIYSRKQEKRFPEMKELKQLIRWVDIKLYCTHSVGMRIDPMVDAEIDNDTPTTVIPTPMTTITSIATGVIRTTANIKMGIPRNACAIEK